MKEIKIVSAFFDIGRGNYATFQRSNDKYFEYFKFWARIQNELIVYCDPENVGRIEEIRRQFGLEEKTTVIPCNIMEIEPDILKKWKRLKKTKASIDFGTMRKTLPIWRCTTILCC